jgi:signal transduction histidine kinase
VSIRLRLTLWYGVVLGAVLLAGGALVWIQLGRDLRSSLDEALQVQASDVSADLDSDSNVSLAVRDPGRPGIFTMIFGASGGLLRETTNAPPLSAAPPAGASEASVAGHTYALFVVAAADGSVIVAGQSVSEIDRAIDGLARSLVFVSGGAMLAALVGGWWLAGRALRPSATLGRELAAIGIDDLGQRVGESGRADEIGRLAAAINSMLERIDEGVRRQNAFVTAASHDLRTPIAAMRTELELAERGPHTRDELVAAIRAAHGDAVRLGNLANDLLVLAEAEPGGRRLLRQPIDARELVDTCVADQVAVAQERGIRVVVQAPLTEVIVDRSRIDQAVRNLLANAIRYSPTGSTVELNATVSSREAGSGPRQTLDISILDRGPGVPANLRAALFLPFAARSGEDHSGLGLATAAVRAHGGAISYSDRPGGGARFAFSVPA